MKDSNSRMVQTNFGILFQFDYTSYYNERPFQKLFHIISLCFKYSAVSETVA